MILGVYGSNGAGHEIMELAEELNRLNHRWKQIIYIDDIKKQGMYRDHILMDLSQVIAEYPKYDVEVIIATGEPFFREMMAQKIYDAGFKLAKLISPTAVVSDRAHIADGVIIMHGCVISCDAVLEENIYLNYYVLIAHDSSVGKNSVLSSKSITGGHVRIGHSTYIAQGVQIRDRINIGSNTIIGMGSVVLRDISDGVIAMGTPARAMKENTERRVFK
jgi:sugar O-acyltransferase (sialic acid O-acetyltransferase NeuD family)